MKPISNSDIDKTIRLIEYLQKIAITKSRICREINDYSHVLWLGEIPKEKGCFTQAWGSNQEYDEDIWIEINLTHEPEFPDPPSICLKWIDRQSIKNANKKPVLLNSIFEKTKNSIWKPDSELPEFIDQTLQLEKFPDVIREWDIYLEQKWNHWAFQYKKWEEIYIVYSKLFLMNQAQKKLGEEYELIVGFGLLSWRTQDNQQIRRHLIVANASLEFEPELGKFTVSIHQDGAFLRPEFDMLDIDQQPVQLEESAKVLLKKSADNPWDKSKLENTLGAIARLLNPKCEFSPILT